MTVRRLQRRRLRQESPVSTSSSSTSSSDDDNEKHSSHDNESTDTSVSEDQEDLPRGVESDTPPMTSSPSSSAAHEDSWRERRVAIARAELQEREKVEQMERIIAKRLIHLQVQFAAFSAVAKRNLMSANDETASGAVNVAQPLIQRVSKELVPLVERSEVSPMLKHAKTPATRVVVSPPQESCGVSEDDRDDAVPCEPQPTPQVHRQRFLAQGYHNSSAGPEEQAAESKITSIHRTWCEMSSTSAPPVEIAAPTPPPPMRRFERHGNSANRTPSNNSREGSRRGGRPARVAAPISPAISSSTNIYSFASIVSGDSTATVATARGSSKVSRPVSPSVAESPLYVARRLRRQFLSTAGECESTDGGGSTVPRDYFSAVKVPETSAAKRLHDEHEKLENEERIYEERLRALEKKGRGGGLSAELLAQLAAIECEESSAREVAAAAESSQRLVAFVLWMSTLRSLLATDLAQPTGSSVLQGGHQVAGHKKFSSRSMQDEESMMVFLMAPERLPSDVASKEEFHRACLNEEEHLWRRVLLAAAAAEAPRRDNDTSYIGGCSPPQQSSPLDAKVGVAKLSSLVGQSVGERQSGHQSTWETNLGFDKVLTMNRMIKDSVFPFLHGGSTEPRKSVRMSISGEQKPFSFSLHASTPGQSGAQPPQPIARSVPHSRSQLGTSEVPRDCKSSSSSDPSPFSTMRTQFGTITPIASTSRSVSGEPPLSAAAVERLPYLPVQFQLGSSSAITLPSTARRLLDRSAPHLAGFNLPKSATPMQHSLL